ncbi:DUF4760 domain-containing protein [Pseudoalteromonas sp. SMS1]|uniref:DUF4760 domain-containing protein n=1 Tax=Pseudoalteromonas sp. SMS1 TaxID=2908894 RepID=UPI001F3831DD|nr:DUF4760 domain-containing protein [Pseudoalteromonas sp. SMS1]MCF2856999.1 DUF4760 domain-containing protein [Pseudoalteromonas sp. SMS1]
MPIYDIISITSEVIVMYVLTFAVFIYIKSQRQKKRAVSLEFVKRWNDGRYQRVFSRILSDPRNHDRDIRDILSDAAMEWESDTNFNDIESIWNFFEELSIAILFDEADEEIAKEYFLYSLTNTYRVSERALYSLRNSNGKGLYLNMERLFGKWTSDKEFTLVREVSK